MEKGRLLEIFDDEWLFEDVPLTVKRSSTLKKTKLVLFSKDVAINIPFVFAGSAGVYIFLDNAEDMVEVYSQLVSKLKLLGGGLFVFAKVEDGGCYYDGEKRVYVDFEDFYDGLDIFRQNHMLPESVRLRLKLEIEDYFEEQWEQDDEERYVRPIINDTQLDAIVDAFEQLDNAPVNDGKYVYYPDGTIKVRRYVSRGFGSGGEYLFPCIEEDQNKKFWVTVLGGWFGVHKFLERKWLQGLLYLLTCGVGGIFYLFDIISMLLGTYSYDVVDYSMGYDRKIVRNGQKYYMKPLEKKTLCAIGGILGGIALTLFAMTCVYRPLLSLVVMLLSSISSENLVNNKDVIDGLGGLTNTTP